MNTTTAELRKVTAERWATFAYGIQFFVGIAVVAVWARADQYGDQPIGTAARVAGGLLCLGFIAMFGRRLVRESTEVRFPRRANRVGFVLILAACAVVALKAGHYVDLFWLAGAFLATGGTCAATAIRYGEVLLPSDSRGVWEPITEGAFFTAWENLTHDRAEAVLQDTLDPRMTLWTLPLDITGTPYEEPLPFTALLGPLDVPVAHYRFVLATDRQEVGR